MQKTAEAARPSDDEQGDERGALWRELAVLVSPDAGLTEVVLMAHASPADYLRDHRGSADDRGLDDEDDSASSALPWFALIDWLVENDLAHELDWNDSAAELAWGLSRMAPVLASGADLQSVDDADVHLTFGILRANALLAPAGLQLLVFDIDADSYPVVVVDAAHAPRIVELAAVLGHRVDQITAASAHRAGGRDYGDGIEL
ncbi:hypothetical protein [Agreia sp. COWG]|uniref:DUF6630 family protein n=1 Tax=Agreia sp. COWG TaxID=2773266 RepID=UPI001927DBF9|nr:hypothetical protein [Agreia sp. COWG]CAD6003303.1 conserved protein of unknown function [Agreia sp. COWG]